MALAYNVVFMGHLRRYCWPAACLLAPALAFLAIHPVLNMGLNDEGAYVWMSKVLADTGRVSYARFIAPSTGPFAYWGAAVLSVFGFSYLALRLSILPMWSACGLLVYLIARRLGLSPAFSALASLSFTLSPIVAPVGAVFMTDIPAMLLILVSIYCVMRALTAGRVSAVWPAASVAAGLTAGAIREILWLAPISFVGMATLIHWRDRRVRILGIVLAAAAVAGAVLLEVWHYSRPDALRQTLAWSLAPSEIKAQAENLARAVLTLVLVCLPAGLCAAGRFTALEPRSRRIVYAWLGIVAFIAIWRPGMLEAPWLGDLITRFGSFSPGLTLPGEGPIVIPAGIRILTGVVTLAVSGVCLAAAAQMGSGMRARLGKPIATEPRLLFAAITTPFVAVYLAVLVHQSQVWPLFDRYLAPVSAIVFLYIACLAAVLKADRPNWAGWVALGILAGFAVANAHDQFAANRAKLAAAEWYTGQGTPRHCISAGYEYDLDTQLTERGVWSQPAPTPRRLTWYLDHGDAVTPYYYVVASRQPQLGSVVREVGYRAWLPPTSRSFLIQLAPGAPPAGCR